VRQQHRLVCLAVLALFGLAVLFGVSACGAGSGLESDSGQAKASERFAARRTVRIEMTAIPKAQTAVDTIVCEGAVDYENDRARMICDLGALGRTETITMGRANYERAEGGPFEDSTRADDKRWTKHTVNDDVDELTDIDPSRQLALLRSGARRTEEIGGDQIRGVPTLHYRLGVEASKVGLTRERQGMRELQSIDVWVDADDLLRRLRFEEDDPDENWHATTTIDFFDFGAPVEIDPPPAGDVLDLDAAITPCVGGETGPLGEEAVSEALRAGGFSVFRDERGCGGAEDIAIELTNLLFDGPHENIEEHDEVTAREGHVLCSLRHRPIYGTGTKIDRRADGRATRFVLENLECSIYPDGDHAEAQVRSLEEALHSLQSELRGDPR
jgi:hypothetical protein